MTRKQVTLHLNVVYENIIYMLPFSILLMATTPVHISYGQVHYDHPFVINLIKSPRERTSEQTRQSFFEGSIVDV